MQGNSQCAYPQLCTTQGKAQSSNLDTLFPLHPSRSLPRSSRINSALCFSNLSKCCLLLLEIIEILLRFDIHLAAKQDLKFGSTSTPNSVILLLGQLAPAPSVLANARLRLPPVFGDPHSLLPLRCPRPSPHRVLWESAGVEALGCSCGLSHGT